MNYWLVKSEPTTYSFSDLLRDKETTWDGVRNNAARLHLLAMRKGDKVLYYHSMEGLEVVGIAKVTKEWYQDPTSDDPRWVAVSLAPVKALKHAVPLAAIKAEPQLQNIGLVRIGRLSVMPLTASEFATIESMGSK